jgi:hypothetical protein
MKVVFTDEFKKSLKQLVWRERLSCVNPAEYYRNIKWFIQRGRRGYSDCDLWNTNNHIAEAVIAYLDHNAQCKMAGYPPDLTEKKWEHHKAEICWLMQQQLCRDTPVEVLRSDAYQKRLASAQRIFGQYWQSLWC